MYTFNAHFELSRKLWSYLHFDFSLSNNEDNYALDKLPDGADKFTDVDEDNLVWEKNSNADNYRLCKAKAAHDAVLGKINTSLAKKTLKHTEAPHLDNEALITNLYDVAETVDLDVSTIFAEHLKDSVVSTVRSRLRKGISFETKSP